MLDGFEFSKSFSESILCSLCHNDEIIDHDTETEIERGTYDGIESITDRLRNDKGQKVYKRKGDGNCERSAKSEEYRYDDEDEDRCVSEAIQESIVCRAYRNLLRIHLSI